MSQDKRNDADNAQRTEQNKGAPSGSAPKNDNPSTSDSVASTPADPSGGGKGSGRASAGARKPASKPKAKKAGERKAQDAAAKPASSPDGRASQSAGEQKSAAAKPTPDTSATRSNTQSNQQTGSSSAPGGGSKPKSTAASASATPSSTAPSAGTARAGGQTATGSARPGGGGSTSAGAHRAGGSGSGGGSAATGIAVGAIVVSVIALGISGWLLYRGQDRLASVSNRLDTVEKGMESSVQDVVMPRLSRLDSRVQSLDSELSRLNDRLEQRGETVSDLQTSLETTQTRLAQLSDQITGNNSRLELNRIESLLRAANQRLQLYHDPEGATRALELANEAIARKNDPRLFDIRGQIANEIAALEALPDPDIEGLALALNAMIERVPELPLASDVPGDYARASEQSGGEEDAASGDGGNGELTLDEFQAQFTQGWDHFKNSVGEALSGMLTIRRADGTQRALLPPDQAFFLNQNLQLELRTARLALLARDTQSYRDALASARQWLDEYYASDAAPVQSMRDRLAQMSNVKLDWDAPDISGSLVMLREEVARSAGGEDAATSSQASGESQSESQSQSQSQSDSRANETGANAGAETPAPAQAEESRQSGPASGSNGTAEQATQGDQ